MTNEQPREIRVPLGVLGRGNYRLTGYSDGVKPTDVVTTTDAILGGKLRGADSLGLKLVSGGGSVLCLGPIK